jgi:pyruvate carboxylase
VVGDLALYLVLKGLTTKDLIDPVTNTAVPGATLLDFPESVVGLMKGELGECALAQPSRRTVVPHVALCPYLSL